MHKTARKRIRQDDSEFLFALDGSIQSREEGIPLRLFRGAQRVTTLPRAVDFEDLAVQVVADLCEEAFYCGEAPAQCARVDLELQLGTLEAACFGFEDVTGKVGGILYGKCDFLAELGDFAAGFDIVGAVAAVVTDGGHEDDLFEMRNVDHFHMRCAGVHAARTAGWEAVYFVGDDFTVCREARVGVVGRCFGGVAETEEGVLFRGADKLALLPFSYAVFEVGCDEGIAGRVIDIEAEGKCVAGEHGTSFGDDLGNLFGNFGRLLFAGFLVHFEVIHDGGKQTLDIRELAAAGGDLKIHFDELDGGGVGLDDLPRKVFEAGETKLVVCSFWLDGAGSLDLVVLHVAVLAGEGHDDNFAKVGDRCEKEAGDALCNSC